MTLVTVFRHVPPPIIGMVGVLPEPRFEAFEKELDWLETTGVLVERLDSGVSRKAAAPARAKRLPAERDASLPLILVDGVVVSRGAFPTRAQLGRLVGRGRSKVRLEVARHLAAIGAAAALGAEDELRRLEPRARELGIGQKRVRAAVLAGSALRETRRPTPA
jgi:hypothetical protein